MFGMRKFVVGTGIAGLLAAGALLLFGQVGVAATQSFDWSSSPAQVTIAAPSAACTAAIQAIKDAVVADRAEDAAERHLAKTGGLDPAADQTEDATEHAHFKALFTAARGACVAAAPVSFNTTRSPACTAAIQAFKAALAQGRPTTKAQWQQLQTLFGNVRTACGFSWSWDRR